MDTDGGADTRAWLEESSRIAELIREIDQALVLLNDKRVTLEEKTISRCMHEISAELSSLLFRLHTKLAQGIGPPAGLLAELSAISATLSDAVAELLKVIRYDLNFLEQYYEFGFYNRLTQECGFLDKLKALTSNIELV